jgi:hypothetical protein
MKSTRLKIYSLTAIGLGAKIADSLQRIVCKCDDKTIKVNVMLQTTVEHVSEVYYWS